MFLRLRSTKLCGARPNTLHQHFKAMQSTKSLIYIIYVHEHEESTMLLIGKVGLQHDAEVKSQHTPN